MQRGVIVRAPPAGTLISGARALIKVYQLIRTRLPLTFVVMAPMNAS